MNLVNKKIKSVEGSLMGAQQRALFFLDRIASLALLEFIFHPKQTKPII